MATKAFPELKGTDTVTEECWRCGGRGNIGYGNVVSTHFMGGAYAQTCFDCLGRGTVTTKVSTIRAREARRAKAEAKRLAEQAEYAARAAEQAAVEEATRHAKEAAEAERRANTPAIVNGRHEVTGEIVGLRVDEQVYGYRVTIVTKIMVLDAEGRKYWGTRPSAIWEAEKGDTVTFTATFEASDDDPTFGFFSRPTKPSYTAAVAK